MIAINPSVAQFRSWSCTKIVGGSTCGVAMVAAVSVVASVVVPGITAGNAGVLFTGFIIVVGGWIVEENNTSAVFLRNSVVAMTTEPMVPRVGDSVVTVADDEDEMSTVVLVVMATDSGVVLETFAKFLSVVMLIFPIAMVTFHKSSAWSMVVLRNGICAMAVLVVLELAMVGTRNGLLSLVVNITSSNLRCSNEASEEQQQHGRRTCFSVR